MKHMVDFTAQDGWLVAHCTCGWTQKWKPAEHIREGHYGSILAVGLKHSLDESNVPSDA